VIAEVQRRLDRGHASLPPSAGYLMYLLIDGVVDSYFRP
jgi:hypothetical protein